VYGIYAVSAVLCNTEAKPEGLHRTAWRVQFPRYESVDCSANTGMT